MSPIVCDSRPARVPLAERWRNLRNRLIANPRFQRFAADFPLTRFVARRRARTLFDLCAGFVYSQILTACVRLDLFARLADGPRGVGELAAGMELPRDDARRLLRAAAALGLVRAMPGDRYALDDLGAAMLGNPGAAAMIAHHELLYDDLRDPVALLRGEVATRLSRFWPYAGGSHCNGESAGAYSELMSRSQAMVAEDILDAFPAGGATRWLDVGGGEGAFAAALATRAPQLSVIVFDLPEVAERARLEMARRGLSGRVEAVGGSFLDGDLPGGADVVSLVRVLHDHDDESALRMLARIHAASRPGATLLIAEPMSGAAGAEPVGDAYFGFYLLAMGSGRPRTAAEIGALLRQAGFVDVRQAPTRRPLLICALTARRV